MGTKLGQNLDNLRGALRFPYKSYIKPQINSAPPVYKKISVLKKAI